MSSSVRRFEDLEVWRKAHEIAVRIYSLSNDRSCGLCRDIGLRDQLRRAVISISSNIAEGFESRTLALYIDFAGRAKASAGEVRSQLRLAYSIGYLDADTFLSLEDQVRHCSAQLHNLITALEKKR